jgi:hypothetical protein
MDDRPQPPENVGFGYAVSLFRHEGVIAIVKHEGRNSRGTLELH